MAKGQGGLEALSFTPAMDNHSHPKAIKRQERWFSYKTALVVHDVFMVLLAFLLGIQLARPQTTFSAGIVQSPLVLVYGFVMIAFFVNFKLYDYHLIFRKRYHLVNAAKAFLLSVCSLGITTTFIVYPTICTSSLFIPGILVLAFTAFFLSRYFWEHIFNIIQVIGLACVIFGLFGILGILEKDLIAKNADSLLITMPLTMALLLVCRFITVHWVFGLALRRHFRRQVVIVGSNAEAKKVAKHIIDQDAPFWIAGVVGYSDNSELDINVPKYCLGEFLILPDIVEKHQIVEIIVTDEKIEKLALIKLLDYCTSKGINAWFPAQLMPIINIKLRVDHFCGIPMVRLCSQKRQWLSSKIKHTVDAVIALPLFILLLPFFAAVALAIKIDTRGPVFYHAKAIGKGARVFDMLKFRTMCIGNDCSIHKDFVTCLIRGEIGKDSCDNKPLKITDDPRVTRVGRFLRKTSLDELPQLINIIKGEMSLVGPRPCLPYEFEIYEDWHKKRTAVRGGISGLWQVTGRSEVAFEDMILLDLYYIYNRSLLMDFNIMIETFFVVLGKKGAY